MPKTGAIYLYEILCDSLDHFSSYTLNVLIQTLEILVTVNSVNDDNLDFIGRMFPNFKDMMCYNSSGFWYKFNTEQKLDAVLMLFSNVAYILSERKDLLELFQVRLSAILQTI